MMTELNTPEDAPHMSDNALEMKADAFRLQRFVEAQDPCFATVLAELRQGAKRTHWMWFVFPQIAGLGHNPLARYYAISSIEEARAYLAHELLAQRLRQVCETILALPADTDPYDVFGRIDTLKLRSSMTLFDLVAPDDIFARVLSRYYDGRRCGRTLRILGIPRAD